MKGWGMVILKEYAAVVTALVTVIASDHRPRNSGLRFSAKARRPSA